MAELRPLRIVSLVPSVTETLLAWRVTPVACTRFCEQPSLPHVGGTKDPDLRAVVAMRPDLVVMDEEENRREDAAELREAGVDVHVTAVRSVDDVTPALKELAERVGRGGVDVADVDGRAQRAEGVRAFVPIWKRPWMTINADTYGSSMLAAVGAVNVFGGAGRRYPVVTLDEVAAAGPDVVLAPSEPYPFGPRHVPELQTVGPVTLVDGQDLFWWGVRTGPALLRLAEVLRACTPERGAQPSTERGT
ncbi:MAG TPA: helical backbone metal receptor [Acidimicrobiales bacterium]|jgi:ABC-type Fe3+-hydroxamate transport system substrate-binding protein|nr:helical backbone metal receptor [Acidimicrobiales bacterium]